MCYIFDSALQGSVGPLLCRTAYMSNVMSQSEDQMDGTLKIQRSRRNDENRLLVLQGLFSWSQYPLS